MPTKRLPSNPSLDHLKYQAKDLQKAHQARNPEAFQRIREFHPRFSKSTDAFISAAKFSLSDAQLAIAREYGFASWERLKSHIEKPGRAGQAEMNLPHHERIENAVFRRAVDLLDAGDVDGLRAHLTDHPGLVHQHVTFEGGNYFRNPTLLEFAAENPIRHGKLPPNIVEVAKVILDAGAKTDSASVESTLGLVCSGRVPRECGVQVPLIDLLCDYGADPNAAISPALGHGEFEAVNALLRRGAKVDLPVAAATGRVEEARRLLQGTDGEGRHRSLALAAKHGHAEIVRLLLDAGEDPNRYNPVGCHSHSTPLHQAVCYGHEEVVRLLVEHGARLDIKDILFSGTALDWAKHERQTQIEEYLRAQGAKTGEEQERSSPTKSGPPVDPLEAFKTAVESGESTKLRDLLERHPELKAKVNEPLLGFESPAITRVRSREMLDVLLDAGADINAKTTWWAGGFGLLHNAEPDLAKYAIERGAIVDAHAAARHGMIDRLRELVTASPAVVHERGGDGQTPLHFANTIEVAGFLLDHGADIEARDVDHESTPAQYMVKDRQEVVRYLIQRGCGTDILMAAALGDTELVRKHLDADPECIRMRVSDEYFSLINSKNGGTIYQWTLGWYVSAHQIARKFGHEEVLKLLMERSPEDVKLGNLCWLGDDAAVDAILSTSPNLASNLSPADRRQIAHAARNNETTAVRLMLKAGWPVDSLSQHGATPLHWAAFHGNVEMARMILRYNPPLEQVDADFKSTPIGWAVHGSQNGWWRDKGEYPATVEALIKAGAKIPEKLGGTDAVKEVLRRHGVKD